MDKSIRKSIEEFSHLPKGDRIENPYGLLPFDVTLSLEIQLICRTSRKEIYFTRLSLKHLLEKGKEGRRMLRILPYLILNPDEIYQGSNPKRFLLVKRMLDIKKGRPQLLAFEITAKKKNVIVSAFQTDDKYLKNFNLLWRSAFPPSQHLLFEGRWWQ